MVLAMAMEMGMAMVLVEAGGGTNGERIPPGQTHSQGPSQDRCRDCGQIGHQRKKCTGHFTFKPGPQDPEVESSVVPHTEPREEAEGNEQGSQ